jgi:DNA-binding transcriptional regulator YdaS (Cro superfamily)
MTMTTRYEALLKVRAHFETEAAMAEAFQVTQPTIWRWLNQSKQIPPEKALLAEQLTGVSCHDLRPDIYPRGLIVGQPYQGDEPLFDACTPLTLPSRKVLRDRRAGDADARIHAAGARAGGRL